MTRAIVFEETVRIRHKILVDYDSDNDLDIAIGKTREGMCLDECVEVIDSTPNIRVKKVIENYDEDSEGVEYSDDYDEEDED